MAVEEKKKSRRKKNREEEKEPVSKKKERKAYEFPGQKRDPPEERDPLRIFYESLYEQLPGCEMAQFWMMENGLLPLEVAKQVYEKKQKKNHQQRLSSPIKTIKSVTVKKNTSTPSKSNSLESKTVLKQLKKRKLAAEDRSDNDDDNFVPVAKKKVKK
ncbi:hypothetical protein Sjap_010004 [Stephania japonica]|uniref:Uncharacterized protein n=1 Tax=Stephania japonica TaxID=461633 RepID=A0AAP0P396_9MAGN